MNAMNADVSVLSAHLIAAGLAETTSLWIGSVVGLITIGGAVAAVFGWRRRAADRAQEELDAAYIRGRVSRDDEVHSMRRDYDGQLRLKDSQLADLRDERDEARRDRDEARRTLAFTQNPLASWQRGGDVPPPSPHPRPGTRGTT